MRDLFPNTWLSLQVCPRVSQPRRFRLQKANITCRAKMTFKDASNGTDSPCSFHSVFDTSSNQKITNMSKYDGNQGNGKRDCRGIVPFPIHSSLHASLTNDPDAGNLRLPLLHIIPTETLRKNVLP